MGTDGHTVSALLNAGEGEGSQEGSKGEEKGITGRRRGGGHQLLLFYHRMRRRRRLHDDV